MSDLILLIGEQVDGPWTWGLNGTGESGIAISEEEKSGLAALSYSRLVTIMPGMQVVSKLHMLENLSDKQKRQAVGFSLEDELAAPLDKTHLAFDPESARISIVARHSLDGLIAAMDAAGLYPDIICADYDSFSGEASFVYDGHLVKNTGNGLGFSIETELAPHVLGAGQNLPHEISREEFLQKIAESLSAGHKPLNLRQGDYVKRRQLSGGRIKRISALAAGLALAFLVLTLGQGLRYKAKAQTAKTEISQIYTQIFPGDEVPKNPVMPILRAQTDQKANKGDEFIWLSSVLASSVKQVEGVEIASLRYDKGKGQLSLSVLYSGFDDVESLKNAALENGGLFSENGTRQNGDGLSGDAVLRGLP